MDRTLLGATTLGQCRTGSNGNKGVLCIPKSSSISIISLSDCLVSYLGHSLGETYPFAEVQSVYSSTPDYWVLEHGGESYTSTKMQLVYSTAPADSVRGHFLWESHIPLQRCSRCILQPQASGPQNTHWCWGLKSLQR